MGEENFQVEVFIFILFFFFNIYLFIWLHWVFAAACGIFSYGTWDLTPQPRIEP